MNRIFVAIFLWAAASAAEIRYGDGTYVQHFTSGGDGDASTNQVAAHGVHGFGVQTGYEGYLVPTKGSSEGGWDLQRGLLAGLVPLAKLALISPFTGGVWLFLALTALVGAGLVCSFTPVCGFNPLGLGRYYLNHDNLNSATAFVMDAIEKHRDQQKKPATAKKEE
ncbi:uncharacterized protein LOC124171363 [Ischnura elegans]|uniref:uncharacterized protein LOC124171363 n=1 Tax=Ischnura elegans TaxID=197161 RepID=UPI001ED89352|nr:uncharacterized protein LOC124171363 [Ischnura elegans]